MGLVLACVLEASAAPAASSAAPTLSLSSLKPMPAPAGWMHRSLPSGGAVLWYPPALKLIPGDPTSVSAAARNQSSVIVAYLNDGPRQGNEQARTWPSFRLAHLRDESDSSVHEDGQAFGVAFRGGTGSCVLDDYVTHVGSHHYREIACFAVGKTSSDVIVATALDSDWTTYASELVRAVEAWQLH